MFMTPYGPYDGNTWESLCQLVFKMKYEKDGYHPMGATPGDYGLEGFTLLSGLSFQCYCPHNHYTTADLHEKQVSKITEDLKKLRKYQREIKQRIGELKIREWHFVTPTFVKNDIHTHARNKTKEVRSWNLDILDANFNILLKDAGAFHVEINQLKSISGETICFDEEVPIELPPLDLDPEEYDENLVRKTGLLIPEGANRETRVESALSRSREDFLQHSAMVKRIEQASPAVFFKLIGIIREYELSVERYSSQWKADPDELLEKVTQGLSDKISRQLGPQISESQADTISRHIVARWMAVCQLDFS